MFRYFILLLSLFIIPCSVSHANDGFSFAVSQNISSLNLLGAENSAQLGARIGYRYRTYQPYLMLDYHMNTLMLYQQDEGCSLESNVLCQPESTQTMNIQTWMLGVGFKKLFSPIQQEQVNGYVLGHAYITVPTVTVNEITYETMNHSFGVTASLGVQYSFVSQFNKKFNSQFNIGAELGLHYISGIQAHHQNLQNHPNKSFINLSAEEITVQNIQVISRVVLEFIL